LIEPPFYRLYHDNFSLVKYPLALGYLSGAIMNGTDWKVQAYNADFNTNNSITVSSEYLSGKGHYHYLDVLNNISSPIWKEVEDAIRDFSPLVVGISSKSQNFASARIVAQITKMIDQDIHVVLGGPHASMAGESVFECEDIDIACIGEGEETIVDLLNEIEKDSPDLTAIKGIYFREGSNIVKTEHRSYIDNLDALKYPIISAPIVLKDFDDYPPQAFSYIFAIRGCPYQCIFCGSVNIWSRKVRYRSPENVLNEIKEIMKYTKHIFFDDDTFGVRKEYIHQLCELMINECPDLTWGCEMSVKLISDDIVASMKAAGCISMMLGIESGNDDMLKKIKKNITVSQALEAIDIVKNSRIKVSTFFVVGFPEETEQSFLDTLSLIRSIRSDSIILSIFTPYPGTETFEQCRQLNLVDDSFDVSLYNHQSPDNHFTAHIDKGRFHKLTNDIIKVVDRKNNVNRLFRVLRSITDRGIYETFKMTVRFIRGRLAAKLMRV